MGDEILYTVHESIPIRFLDERELVSVLDALASVRLSGLKSTDLTRIGRVRSAVYQTLVLGKGARVVRRGDGKVEWDAVASVPQWFHSKFDQARDEQSLRELEGGDG